MSTSEARSLRGTHERRTLAIVVGIAALATLATTLHPRLRFALELPNLHMVIETLTVAASVGLCTIFVGRFAAYDRTAYLVLAYGFGVAGVGEFLTSTLPHSLTDHPTDSFTSWAPMFIRLVLAASLAMYALAPGVMLLPGLRSQRTCLAWIAATVASVSIITAVAERWLPTPLDPDLTPASSDRAFITGHLATTTVHLIGLVLFVGAAIGFLRRYRRTDDRLKLWLAASTALMAIAWLNYLMFPSVYTHYFYVGDAIRLASTGVLMIGVLDEFRDHWRARVAASGAEERRRMAHELHDGLAQELALISSSLRARSDEHGEFATLANAAERALAESRLAILALSAAPFASLDEAVARAAEDAAHRHGVRLELTVDGDPARPEARPEARELFMRVVQECIANASRHGRAGVVRVELDVGDPLTMRVIDNGCGFDPPARRGGFGLQMMRERIETAGGTSEITSSPGAGTTVEVTLP